MKNTLNYIFIGLVLLVFNGCAMSAGMYAAKGNVKGLDEKLKEGTAVNSFEYNMTPLHRAANNGQYLAAKYLVEHGADVNILSQDDEQAWTPLRYAIEASHDAQFWPNMDGKRKLDVVKLLVDNGADIHVKDKYGRTYLHIVARQTYDGAIDIAKYLISKGLNVNEKSNTGFTPLHQNASASTSDKLYSAKNSLAMAKTLIEKGANPYAQTNSRGDTPGHTAACYGRKILIENVYMPMMIATGKDPINKEGRKMKDYWDEYYDFMEMKTIYPPRCDELN